MVAFVMQLYNDNDTLPFEDGDDDYETDVI